MVSPKVCCVLYCYIVSKITFLSGTAVMATHGNLWATVNQSMVIAQEHAKVMKVCLMVILTE